MGSFFLLNFDDSLVTLWGLFGATLVPFYESGTKVSLVGATLVTLCKSVTKLSLKYPQTVTETSSKKMENMWT